MTELTYKFKSDILFKMIFARYPKLRHSLVAAALGVPPESIQKIEVRNPEIPPEEVQGKFCRLDLNMLVDGQQVDLEIQVGDEGNFRERALYYCSKLFASGLHSAGKYINVPRTILISIVWFKLFDGDSVQSDFAVFERTRHELLTDKMELIFFELLKLPKEIDTEDMMQVWLKVFRAETEEDLSALERMGVEEVTQVVEAYNTITQTDEYRELERMRDKRLRDEANALSVAEQRGEQRGIEIGEQRGEQRGIEIGEQRGKESGKKENALENAKVMKADDVPAALISKYTGLTPSEIEAL